MLIVLDDEHTGSRSSSVSGEGFSIVLPLMSGDVCDKRSVTRTEWRLFTSIAVNQGRKLLDSLKNFLWKGRKLSWSFRVHSLLVCYGRHSWCLLQIESITCSLLLDSIKCRVVFIQQISISRESNTLIPLFDAKITTGVPLSISDHHHWNFLYLCGFRNLYIRFQMEWI